MEFENLIQGQDSSTALFADITVNGFLVEMI